MTSIDIEFDVWQALTGLRRDEADSYSAVLRRLLQLPGAERQTEPAEPGPSAAQPRAGEGEHTNAWAPKGVPFPETTQFRLRHRGVTHSAHVANGFLELEDGRQFSSPSAAGVAVTGTSVNGWRVWECKLPGASTWTTLDVHRRRRGHG